MGRDVFISHSQSDRLCAIEMVEHLEAHGISTWVAPRDVNPGAEWAEQIIDAIAAARLMVLVFSERCNASPQVRREVERAVHRGLPVLTLRLEDILPTRSLEYFLSAQHWMDAFGTSSEARNARVLEQVVRLLKGGHTDALPPTITSTADLRSLEAALLEHLGPIASILLQRAVESGVTGPSLVDALAGEIDSPPHRAAFLARCRSAQKS